MNEKEVIRTLKSERCPPSVLERVQAAIRSEKSSSTGRRWRIPVGITVAAAVLMSLIFMKIKDYSPVTEENAAGKKMEYSIDETVPAAPAADDYLAEAQKLKFVFTYIGLTLAEETERNRDIILRSTIPVVKDSIVNTEEFINQRIRGRKL